MMLVIALATMLASALLGLVTFVQLLYLESLRLRTRDLPSLKFFKDTLEDQIGLKTELGMGSYSLIKHTLLVLVTLCYFAWFADGLPWGWSVFWQAGLTAWLTLLAFGYALPQLLYRRTQALWVVPFVPMLRGLAWIAWPFETMLSFFQSLIELTEDKPEPEEATPAENIEALISAGTEEGLIEEEDRKLIQSVVEFGDKVVREVMTARPNIVAISADSTLEQLRQLVITEQYSRIPVFEMNIDQIIGFVHVRDMFEVEEEQRERLTVRETLPCNLLVCHKRGRAVSRSRNAAFGLSIGGVCA